MPLPFYANIRERHTIKIYGTDGTYQKVFANKDITILEDGTELTFLTVDRVENYELIKEML